MFLVKVIIGVLFCVTASRGEAAAVIEKAGRFEINWSTGKVRFYGTSLLDQKEADTWRSAEQRAWSDGITYLQKNMPQTMSDRSGLGGLNGGKISNPMSVTSSVNTTYFGDSRIKVALESPLADLFSQLASDAAKGNPVSSGSKEQSLILKVTNKTTPTAVFSVVDESGASLLSSTDMAATFVGTSVISRWYRSKPVITGVSEVPENTPEIKVTAVSAGVLKVAKADWRPEYASIVASGRAAVVLP